MCGRFAITLPTDAMAQLFDAAPANDLPVVPNYNVCPTTQVHVLRQGATGRSLVAMRWGFLPHWYKARNGGPLLINSRSETIAEKPAFRAACRERRCLIPMDGFYEWYREGDEKLPYFVSRKDGQPMVVAGVWQSWEVEGDRIDSCAIVTTEAVGEMARVHHRVPVILDTANWGKWLGEEGHGAARLMQAVGDDVIGLYRVGREVNSNRATGAGLLAPLTEE
jgi:putative SOS response-associated peptidase YedK